MMDRGLTGMDAAGYAGQVLEPVQPVGTSDDLHSFEGLFTGYWRLFGKHKWTVVAAVLVAVAGQTIYCFLAAPRYRAVSRIAVFRESGEKLALQSSDASRDDGSGFNVMLHTQVALLQSDTLGLQVIKDLHLEANREFRGTPNAAENPAGPPGMNPIDSRSEDELLKR